MSGTDFLKEKPQKKEINHIQETSLEFVILFVVHSL